MITAKEAQELAQKESKDYEIKLVQNFRDELDRHIRHAASNGLFEITIAMPLNMGRSTAVQITNYLNSSGFDTLRELEGLYIKISWRKS